MKRKCRACGERRQTYLAGKLYERHIIEHNPSVPEFKPLHYCKECIERYGEQLGLRYDYKEEIWEKNTK